MEVRDGPADGVDDPVGGEEVRGTQRAAVLDAGERRGLQVLRAGREVEGLGEAVGGPAAGIGRLTDPACPLACWSMTALATARELGAFFRRNGGRTPGSAAVVLDGLVALVSSGCAALSGWDPALGRHRALASTYPSDLTGFIDHAMHTDPLFVTVRRGRVPVRVRDPEHARQRAIELNLRRAGQRAPGPLGSIDFAYTLGLVDDDLADHLTSPPPDRQRGLALRTAQRIIAGTGLDRVAWIGDVLHRLGQAPLPPLFLDESTALAALAATPKVPCTVVTSPDERRHSPRRWPCPPSPR